MSALREAAEIADDAEYVEIAPRRIATVLTRSGATLSPSFRLRKHPRIEVHHE